MIVVACFQSLIDVFMLRGMKILIQLFVIKLVSINVMILYSLIIIYCEHYDIIKLLVVKF